MNDLRLLGFLGIEFGSDQQSAKDKLQNKNGVLDTENSNINSLLYNNINFAGRHTELIILTFFKGQFCKANVFIKPKLDSQIIHLYNEIKNEINQKYYITDDDFETYDYPYEKNDGYTETAISLGNAQFSCFWKFYKPGKEDDYISVKISEDLEIIINYENGELTDLMVSKNKAQDSLDY